MLMNADRSHLLVVDLQARLMPAILEGETIIPRVNILSRAAARLGVPVTVTEQYPQGLGPTVPAVLEAVPEDAAVLRLVADDRAVAEVEHVGVGVRAVRRHGDERAGGRLHL